MTKKTGISPMRRFSRLRNKALMQFARDFVLQKYKKFRNPSLHLNFGNAWKFTPNSCLEGDAVTCACRMGVCINKSISGAQKTIAVNTAVQTSKEGYGFRDRPPCHRRQGNCWVYRRSAQMSYFSRLSQRYICHQ